MRPALSRAPTGVAVTSAIPERTRMGAANDFGNSGITGAARFIILVPGDCNTRCTPDRVKPSGVAMIFGPDALLTVIEGLEDSAAIGIACARFATACLAAGCVDGDTRSIVNNANSPNEMMPSATATYRISHPC